MRGDRAFVLVGDEYGAAQLLAYDLTDPAHPDQLAALDLPVSDLEAVRSG